MSKKTQPGVCGATGPLNITKNYHSPLGDSKITSSEKRNVPKISQFSKKLVKLRFLKKFS